MEPIRGWITKPHHTEACMVLQLSPLFMDFHLVHIPFLDAAAKYSVLFGDSLPPTLISQRAQLVQILVL